MNLPHVATTLLVVKSTEFPPAVGTLTTARNETLPIFDPLVLADARTALERHLLVFITPRVSETTRTTYASAIHEVDPSVSDMLCVFCDSGSGMVKQANPDRFACVRCGQVLYLAQPPSVDLRLEYQARARLDRVTDAIFWLDHSKHEAHYVEAIPNEVQRMPPNHGTHATIEPDADLHDERTLNGKTLRLQGHPWNGRTTYRVMA